MDGLDMKHEQCEYSPCPACREWAKANGLTPIYKSDVYSFIEDGEDYIITYVDSNNDTHTPYYV